MMNPSYTYAGIGARKTPDEFLCYMTEAAQFLEVSKHYTLRTGGANGADSAFEAGVGYHKMLKVYRASDTGDAAPRALEIAMRHHPKWFGLTGYVKDLMVRNVMILLGPQLDSPVDFVLCWTPNGEIVGGTGHSLRVAAAHNIPMWNFGIQPKREIAEFILNLPENKGQVK